MKFWVVSLVVGSTINEASTSLMEAKGSGIVYDFMYCCGRSKSSSFFVAFCSACFASDLSTLPARFFRSDLKCDRSTSIF